MNTFFLIADDIRQKAGQLLALTENSTDDHQLTEASRIAEELTVLAVQLELLGSPAPQREKVLRMLEDAWTARKQQLQQK